MLLMFLSSRVMYASAIDVLMILFPQARKDQPKLRNNAYIM